MAYENFNAASAVFHIKGVNVHPGEAKDIMVNAALVGCEIVSRLPEAETPAHTNGREGFYHLTDMSGDVASATLSFIIRDHDKTTFEKRLQNLRDVAQSMNQKYGPETVTLDIEHSYENMLSVIEDKMEIVDLAKQAMPPRSDTALPSDPWRYRRRKTVFYGIAVSESRHWWLWFSRTIRTHLCGRHADSCPHFKKYCHPSHSQINESAKNRPQSDESQISDGFVIIYEVLVSLHICGFCQCRFLKHPKQTNLFQRLRNSEKDHRIYRPHNQILQCTRRKNHHKCLSI